MSFLCHAIFHAHSLFYVALDTCQGLEAEAHTIFRVFLRHQDLLLLGQALPEIAPIIIRLIPQLLKTTFYRGSVVIAQKVTPASDEALERELNRKIRTKKGDDDKDNQSVVKVKDAIDCVRSNFDNTTLIKEFVLVAVKSLIEGRQSTACGQALFDKMATCIREHALRQDTPRKKNVTIKLHRPSRGHGKGRKGFSS